MILASAGFYVWGKTEIARSFILPLAVSGLFLFSAAAGLFFANKPRIKTFEQAYSLDHSAFIESEIERTANSDHDLQLIVYKVLPIIAIISGIVVLLLPGIHVRAWAITLIMLSGAMMLIDANTHKRNADYRTELLKAVSVPQHEA